MWKYYVAAAAAVVVLILIIVLVYWMTKPRVIIKPKPDPKPDPNLAPKAVPNITYTTVTTATPESSGQPALPATIVISNQTGQTAIQYGDETPVTEDEHFQPYMSILTNDVFRSDASFDASKPEY